MNIFSFIGTARFTLESGKESYSDLTVTLVGFFSVLLSLAVISVTCLLVGLLIKKLSDALEKKSSKGSAKTEVEKLATAPAETVDPLAAFANRDEVLAAISVAIAEDSGEDFSKIRIISIQKLN